MKPKPLKSNQLWNSLEKLAAVYGGYIPLDLFLAIVTKHYYQNNANIGGIGDFITAPEVSSFFGQTLAIAICSFLDQLNQLVNDIDSDLIWIEIGPGNGTLFCDMWNLISKMPQYSNRVKHIVFVEYSELMTKIQSQLNSTINSADLPPISWVSSIEKLDKFLNSFDSAKIIIIANEFFDALPIKQYVFADEKWNQTMVKLKQKSVELVIADLDYEFNSAIKLPEQLSNGSILELSPARQHAATIVADILDKYGGVGLLIDYGYIKYPLKSTIQSVINHQKLADPFPFLGQADISSLVDFGALTNFFANRKLDYTLRQQGEFLKLYGIDKLVAKAYNDLIKNSKQKAAEDLLKNTEILINGNKMGEVFYVLQVEKVK
mgnify:CR=1 FL=1